MTPYCKNLAMQFWNDEKYEDLSIEAILWIHKKHNLLEEVEYLLEEMKSDEGNN